MIRWSPGRMAGRGSSTVHEGRRRLVSPVVLYVHTYFTRDGRGSRAAIVELGRLV